MIHGRLQFGSHVRSISDSQYGPTLTVKSAEAGGSSLRLLKMKKPRRAFSSWALRSSIKVLEYFDDALHSAGGRCSLRGGLGFRVRHQTHQEDRAIFRNNLDMAGSYVLVL